MSSNELSADEVLLAPIALPTDAVQRLERGRVTLVGRMRNASNGTFLVRVDDPITEPASDGESPPWGLAIYKPLRGERPLWDFEPGLYRREVAAYVLSEATGLGVVPPTVVRDDAPFGVGSLQWFVNADFSHHYFSIAEEHPELDGQLRAIAAFDVMANNTDRKGGHCLLVPAPAEGTISPRASDEAPAPLLTAGSRPVAACVAGERNIGHVWAIDNGLCFAETFKLRTVIWEYAGEQLGDALLSATQIVADGAPAALGGLLTDDEITAIELRASQLVDIGVFPFDQSSHGYPWPLV